MNDWDQASRYAFRRIDPEGVPRWLMGLLAWFVWGWPGGWLDSQTVPFPGERARG